MDDLRFQRGKPLVDAVEFCLIETNLVGGEVKQRSLRKCLRESTGRRSNGDRIDPLGRLIQKREKRSLAPKERGMLAEISDTNRPVGWDQGQTPAINQP